VRVPVWIVAIFRRDLLLIRDAPWGLVLSLASTVLGVLLFGLLGRFVGSGTGYVTFVLSGIAFLRVTDAIVQAPGLGLREERSRGSLEVLLDSPRPAWAIVLLSGVVPALRSLIEGTIALTTGLLLFHADINPGWRGVIAVPLAVLTLVALALATGLLIAAASMQSRAATAASTFFGLAIAMTAGVYYPRSALPPWLRTVTEVSPFTAALNGLRDALVHAPMLKDLSTGLGAAGLMAAIGSTLMSRAVTTARQSGAFARG
jgi:ABC-type multidrug transport system permease subunit